MSAITSFSGPYRWLSNFWPTPIELDGSTYRSVEHAYVASKTLINSERASVIKCETAGRAKRLGRSLTLRADWDHVKLGLMEGFVRQKFDDPELMELLKGTSGRELIEGNTWGDRFWGVCDGSGRNHLGKILMRIRDAS